MNRHFVNFVLFVALAVATFQPAWAMETTAREALLLDMRTGTLLLDKDADKPMPPSSMSKLMTAYMLFEALRDGRVSLDDTFRVSERAWKEGGAATGGSTMFLEPGSLVRVEDLLRGIIVQSGNDACIVVAENLAGSEEAFTEAMNAKAVEIGLKDSVFRNSTGWPNPEHRMTARDLAKLAQRIIKDFPEFYRYYSETEFTYNGISQPNRNPLLTANIGADGLKTGHTQAAGYGLTASARRGDRRLILVVNGLDSNKSRREESQRLMEWGFREFNNYPLFKAGEKVSEAGVWLGTLPSVPLVVGSDVEITIPRASRRDMVVKVVYDGPIPAPITAGSQLARLLVSAPGMETIDLPLVAATDAPRLGLVGRLKAVVRHVLLGGPI